MQMCVKSGHKWSITGWEMLRKKSDTKVHSSYLWPKWYKWSDTHILYIFRKLTHFADTGPYYEYENIFFSMANKKFDTKDTKQI